MPWLKHPIDVVPCLALVASAAFLMYDRAWAQSKPASSGEAGIVKAVGTIKSVQSGSITVAAESGGEVNATLVPSTKILRVPPGEKDLKNATPLQAQDLQTGDRVLVRGQASPDAHTIAALAVIVMKQAEVTAQHQRETEDWQKRGVGGLVTKVDVSAGAITISAGGLAANRDVVVRVNKDTVLRRYAAGSIKFDDARPAPLDQIKIGDQLRARGARSQDGSELVAEEIVSGSFRNIAGTITTMDPSSHTITVHDLIAKSAVVVEVSAESQLKKLPPDVAQRIAARFKSAGGANGDQPQNGQNANPQNASAPNAGAQGASQSGNAGRQGNQSNPGGGQNGHGTPDVQRLVSRLPNSSLADLQKGEAVMIVATPGANGGAVTAITLLAGVEPILTAAPSRSSYSLLSPWSLNASGGEGDSTP